MEKFVDRSSEMKALEDEYKREGSSLVVLYGRRRVGKTTLISEFIKNKKALFFLASEESETQNCNMFKERAADFLQNDLLRTADLNWDMLFKILAEQEYASKPVIVIDEFQYLGKSNPAFPSVFQRIWDERLKERSIMVILCGSLVSMMVSQALSYTSPLYGRRTAQIRLAQIPFRYYHEFFPDRSPRDLIELYAVTGGVPKYIRTFSAEKDIFASIEKNILNRSSYLYDEPYFLLQKEISEIGSYFSIIKAISAGNRKLSAIAGALEINATHLTKYLKTLIDLDILERKVPVTEEKPEISKKGLYYIKDNYIRFWFAFIYPNISFIESGNPQIVMEKIQKSFVRMHVAYVYEDICREKMWELNARDIWPFHFTKVGGYWDSKNEIDIAAIDVEGKNLILGKCKYWSKPVDETVLFQLEKKSDFVQWNYGNRNVWYILFSISGFTDKLKQIAANRKDIILSELGAEKSKEIKMH